MWQDCCCIFRAAHAACCSLRDIGLRCGLWVPNQRGFFCPFKGILGWNKPSVNQFYLSQALCPQHVYTQSPVAKAHLSVWNSSVLVLLLMRSCGKMLNASVSSHEVGTLKYFSWLRCGWQLLIYEISSGKNKMEKEFKLNLYFHSSVVPSLSVFNCHAVVRYEGIQSLLGFFFVCSSSCPSPSPCPSSSFSFKCWPKKSHLFFFLKHCVFFLAQMYTSSMKKTRKI